MVVVRGQRDVAHRSDAIVPEALDSADPGTFQATMSKFRKKPVNSSVVFDLAQAVDHAPLIWEHERNAACAHGGRVCDRYPHHRALRAGQRIDDPGALPHLVPERIEHLDALVELTVELVQHFTTCIPPWLCPISITRVACCS